MMSSSQKWMDAVTTPAALDAIIKRINGGKESHVVMLFLALNLWREGSISKYCV